MAEPGKNERNDLGLAVVVGAGGMGLAVARRLGQSYRLLLTDVNAEHLASCAEQLHSEGHDVLAVACDITDAGDVAGLAAAAAAAGPVTGLAHVAGLSPTAVDFDLIVSVNLIGTRLVADAFVDVLAPGSAAVFISSMAAHTSPVPDELLAILDEPLNPTFLADLRTALGEGAHAGAAYMLSKAALNRHCRRLAGPWGARGLRVVSLSPGLIATPMGAASYETSPDKRALFDALPLGREGTMVEIAGPVEFLLSSQASFISGTDILVDGGLMGALGAAQG